MSNLPATRASWPARAWATVTRAFRLPTIRRRPAQPGVTVGRVSAQYRAEDDLAAMAKSPVVYAAVHRRALGLSSYPIRCYRGTQGKAVELDPDRVPWVADLQRLLQTPDPADMDRLFPESPGEGVMAQVIADLLQAGNAYVAVTTAPSGAITGLYRLHPRCVSKEATSAGMAWVHRVSGQPTETYPVGTVAHLRMLSYQSSAQAALGVGAGTPLRPLISAEVAAMEQTAEAVEQGGPDILVTGKDAIGQALLESDEKREAIANRFTEAMKKIGRRVMVLGGALDIKEASWKPADLKAPELMTAAKASELMALGVTPISVGADSGTYATAVQQYRVQAEWDEQLQMVIEAGLLRPLARQFARAAGGRWAARLDQVTCRIDLSTHPGYAYLRSDALARMKGLVELGWTAEQAAAVEGLDLPPPEGEPVRASSATPATDAPRRPLGDTTSDPGAPADPGQQQDAPRMWWSDERRGEVVAIHPRH